MNKATLFFVAMITMALSVNAQDCKYTDLSTTYDYEIHNVLRRSNYVVHSAPLEVRVLDKKTGKTVQRISFLSGVLFLDKYENCGVVRSFITGKNKDAAAPGNDHGNLIIADLNFDGKEDIAIKYDSSNTGGPIYNFYTQQADGTFKKDTYLSNSVMYFPVAINNKNKTLRINVPIGIHKHTETTYQYNNQTNSLKIVNHKLVANKI